MDDMEAMVAFWNNLQATAEEFARQMMIPYIKGEITKQCSRTGIIGQQVIGDSVAAALEWYGMYTPKVYRRGMTLSNPDNISVGAGNIETDGHTGSAELLATNMSPHAGYSFGFPMRNGLFRPAGDVIAIGRHYSGHIDIPDDVLGPIWEQAMVKAAKASQSLR